jgi:hypothetical protein
MLKQVPRHAQAAVDRARADHALAATRFISSDVNRS